MPVRRNIHQCLAASASMSCSSNIMSPVLIGDIVRRRPSTVRAHSTSAARFLRRHEPGGQRNRPPDQPGGAGLRSWSAVPADRSLTRFQPTSRATARSVIPTMAKNVSGALRSVSTAKNPSTITVAPIPSSTMAARGARLRSQAVAGEPDEQEHHERAGASDRGDGGEVDEVRQHQGEGRGDEQASVLPEPRASAEDRRKLPDLRQRGRQADRTEERAVRRPRRRDERCDGHQREAGVAETSVAQPRRSPSRRTRSPRRR